MPDEIRRRRTLVGLAAITILALLVSFLVDSLGGDDGGERTSRVRSDDPVDGDEDGGDETEQPGGERWATDYEGLADPAGFLRPYPNAAVEGLLTFRGNPSRSYYGTGPVPRTAPEVLHRFPDEPMCRESVNLGETKVWCGMGWTGQPTIVEREDRTWVIFGGYDGNIHFMDAATGERVLPDVPTDDIIKGTPTIDPDGYPLVYAGSRDDHLRIIAFDRAGQAEVLWQLHAEEFGPVLWNDDWDSSPIIVGDHLVVGSESSRFWVIRLNRSTDDAGLVQVDPQIVFTTEAWDQEVLAVNGDQTASVESSPSVYENTAYVGTSAGLVLGYDLSGLDEGRTPEQVFRFFTGGDNDASIVIDEDGMLYVGSQYDRDLPRAAEVGQLTKIDPSVEGGRIVWKVDEWLGAGVYGTPAVTRDMVYATTDAGRVLGVDRETGAVVWEKHFELPLWASPVVVDDVLLVGDCSGSFHAYDVSAPAVDPPELWSIELGGCIEATPAVWKGRIYLGSRAGHLFVLG